MNKWAVYWMLHCVGFAGFAVSLLLLPHNLMPPWILGGLGGAWCAGWSIYARLLVRRK